MPRSRCRASSASGNTWGTRGGTRGSPGAPEPVSGVLHRGRPGAGVSVSRFFRRWGPGEGLGGGGGPGAPEPVSRFLRRGEPRGDPGRDSGGSWCPGADVAVSSPRGTRRGGPGGVPVSQTPWGPGPVGRTVRPLLAPPAFRGPNKNLVFLHPKLSLIAMKTFNCTILVGFI